MLTLEGLAFLAGVILPTVQGAVVLASDGTEVVERPLDEGFPKLSDDGRSVIFQATFGPREANFEWRAEGVKVGDQRIEWEERDAGRKPLGAIWTVQVAIDITA